MISKPTQARMACPCEPACGITYLCPATLMPRMGENMVIQGDVSVIPYPMPIKFECPRHQIMGW